jgi:hypothetical protein
MDMNKLEGIKSLVGQIMAARLGMGFAYKEGAKEALEAAAVWAFPRGKRAFIDAVEYKSKQYEYPRGSIEMPWGTYVRP